MEDINYKKYTELKNLSVLTLEKKAVDDFEVSTKKFDENTGLEVRQVKTNLSLVSLNQRKLLLQNRIDILLAEIDQINILITDLKAL